MDEKAAMRSELEELHGAENVWNTTELQETFKVISFLAPLCEVIRKSDGVSGWVQFVHYPRFYFGFSPRKG